MKINELKGDVEYNDQLSSKAWSGSRLRPEVRYKLLQTSKKFIDYLDIPGFRVLDIVLTGSMANFNYTDYSDFDVHVVTKYADLECDDLAEAFYRAKKQLWNDYHDVIIRGHDVEMYVEDINEPPVSAGIYSLLDDQWIKKPDYNPPEFDRNAVRAKVQDLIKQIDVAIETADDPEDLKRIGDKLRDMRRAGLAEGGEFSVENLAFKVLRNRGYIDRLYKEYNHQQDIDLSI
jgi:predicted nucleotidyltransferase